MTAPLRRLHFGIAAKIAIWAVLIGVPVAAVVGYLMYRGSVDLLVSRQQASLSAAVAVATTRLTAGFDSAERDARLLLATPTVAGLQRAAGNNGVDPTDGATEAALLDRTAVLFAAMLDNRTGYFSIRLVGPTGHELLRVNRGADGKAARVPDARLQDRSERPYFSDVARLRPGDVYVSGFELNRENGVIETPFQPTTRVVVPLVDSVGALIGTVVINVDLGSVFDAVAHDIGPGALTFIADSAGDYLVNPDAPGNIFGFNLGQTYRLQDDYPEVASLLASGNAYQGVVQRAGVTYLADARRASVDPANPANALVVAALVSEAGIVHEATALRDRTAAVAGLVILVGVLFAFVLARMIVRPLRAVTAAASEIAAGRRDVDLSAFSGRDDETGALARAMSVMVREIAEREDRMQGQADELTRSNQELAQFAYVASHDLQEPLRMVGSYLELLARRYEDKLDDEAQEFIGFAVDGATRMKRLINDLLGYSRAGNSPLKREPVDSRELVETVLASLTLQIEDAHAEVRIAGLPQVRVDPVQYGRVFQNLVENAIKYRAPDTRPLIEIGAVRKDGLWCFSVADNGIGIDPVFKDKIFEIFKRLHGRDRYSGTGIGLAVTKLVVERHGGRIWVEPRAGGGSVFYFTLPDSGSA
ncbi:MAG TPA: ATP-binding protein [Bauldia sp.]|nr:ATP-binding protein [Bauldia sp.]